MHNFILDKDKCVSCGQCVADCAFGVLEMQDGNPKFERPERCIGCLHCYAVCPTGSITMDEYDPAKASPMEPIPSPENAEAFIRQRRSIRRFRQENIDPSILKKMLEIAWSAPSGINQHLLQVSVIADMKEMDAFKKGAYDSLREMKQAGNLKNDYLAAVLGPDTDEWLKNDRLFRKAPHLVAVSAAPDASTGIPDCFIYLSYLEMLAYSMGYGALWCGLAFGILNAIPEAAKRLGIPADHKIGYVMLLGIPAERYARGVERHNANIRFVKIER